MNEFLRMALSVTNIQQSNCITSGVLYLTLLCWTVA